MVFQRFKKAVLAITNFDNPTDIQRIINTLQNSVADSINPMASKIQNDSVILTNQVLIAGQNNIINTTLNRNLIGYNIIRLRAPAIISDTQDKNPSPNLTLWLTTSANVTVDIEVF